MGERARSALRGWFQVSQWVTKGFGGGELLGRDHVAVAVAETGPERDELVGAGDALGEGRGFQPVAVFEFCIAPVGGVDFCGFHCGEAGLRQGDAG